MKHQDNIISSGVAKYLSTLITSLVLCVTAGHAQVHWCANIQNNHLWRGMEVADGAVVMSDLSYTVARGHVTLGLWGGTNTQGTYNEFNHYASLSVKGLSLALWDTYNFSPGATYNNHEYFNYSAHTTGRFLDCTASYRFTGRLPLLLSWSTILFGRDRNVDNTEQKYSTFVYAEYPVWKNDDWKVEAGVGGAFALNRAGDDTHFYGTTAGIIHLTLAVTRDLHLGSHTLPVYARGMWNPQSSEAYFQIGAEVLHF